jgi:hypothetical protein
MTAAQTLVLSGSLTITPKFYLVTGFSFVLKLKMEPDVFHILSNWVRVFCLGIYPHVANFPLLKQTRLFFPSETLFHF